MGYISAEFNAKNKKSVAKLQAAIIALEGEAIPAAEKKTRVLGKGTAKLLEKHVARPVTAEGQLTPKAIEAINAALLAKKYEDKASVDELHNRLALFAKKKFIAAEIDAKEKESKTIGKTTESAIRAFQKKYKLKQTGKLDVATDEKLESLATSIAGSKPQPRKMMKAPSPLELRRVVRGLRLNMAGEKVQHVQKGLASLGYTIPADEAKAGKFGKHTRDAVARFQTENKLLPSGEMDKATAKALNMKLAMNNPAVAVKGAYRVRGSVRNELWEGKGQVTVRVYEKGLRGAGKLLAEKKTFSNGFFDILYAPPQAAQSQNQGKKPLHLVVQYVDENGRELHSKTYSNVPKTLWANYTEGAAAYKGDSEFATLSNVITKALMESPLGIKDIEESAENKDISHLQRETGLHPHQILTLSLAHRVAESIGQPATITPEVVFALLRLNLPPELPGDIFPDSPEEWHSWLPPLVEKIATGIVFLEESIRENALQLALSRNIISRRTGKNIATITAQFRPLVNRFVLEKPLLVGDGTMGDLLALTNFTSAEKNNIAKTFYEKQGINNNFWAAIADGGILSATKTKALKNIVDIGTITKNHVPLVSALFQKVTDASDSSLKESRDLAKLNIGQWKTLINQTNAGIPANIDGETPQAKLTVYATELFRQAEQLFPDVAMVAEVSRHTAHGLKHTLDIQQFTDANPDFNLIKDDVEKANTTAGNALPREAVLEAKAIQRIRRIAPSAEAGAYLLDAKFHSSAQIYFHGRERFSAKIQKIADNIIPKETLEKIYAGAEHQYAHTLAKVTQYRFDMFKANPVMVPDFKYKHGAITLPTDDAASLELLFGSLDYCECGSCSSVYSPAAYFTDLMRFLSEKDAVKAGDSVQEVLLNRRPDLKNIKLNCDNTHTPMPYIDLVNEVLENAIPPQNSNFSYQSTLTAAELKAIPQHVRSDAYDHLKNQFYPMHSAFNLWEEETRLFLQHLGVERHALMQAWQDRSDADNPTPVDADIALEYFGISTQEKAWIIPPASEGVAAKQTEYWGFSGSSASVTVSRFLEKANITYNQLLELLQVKWLNPTQDTIVIERPVDDCDVEKQKITGLTPARLDKMHRFLRLWRRTHWQMWELDLLLRNDSIGHNAINDAAIIRLMQFHKLQQKLGLNAEKLLTFYGNLNTEARQDAENFPQVVEPLYHRLFQNIAITNPLDAHFALPLANGAIDNHTTTILSALAIDEASLARLLPLTNGLLNLETLSTLYRYSTLAKALKISVDNLLLLLETTGMATPFATPETTVSLLERHDTIKESGLSLLQLHYVLRHAQDSSAGLRDEVVQQYAELLRGSLFTLYKELFGANQPGIAELRSLSEKYLHRLPEQNATDIPAMLDLIEGKWVGTDAERTAFISANFSAFIAASANPSGTLTQTHFWDDNVLTEAEEQDIVTRYNYVIGHLYATFNRNTIKEHIGNYLKIAPEITDIVLNRLQTTGGESLLAALQNPQLIEADAEGSFIHPLEQSQFPDVFFTYRLLHKTALLVEKMALDAVDVEWFLNHHTITETLNINTLPVNAEPATDLFPQWLNWHRLMQFKRAFPEPEGTSLYSIIELGANHANPVAEIYADIALLTQWDKAALKSVAEGIGLKHAAGKLHFTRAENLHRLWACFTQLKRTGVNTIALFDWADKSGNATNDQLLAQRARRAAKSKYTPEEWLNKVQPIQDELREKQRSALVAWLIEDALRNQPAKIGSNPNPLYFRNSYDLYSYYLIDVEMSACQMTSRIVQATSAIQLFVQRCMLNLEAHLVKVPLNDADVENNWNQWKWMKNYRVWEANRKVFLYPENWIEPELRDDKSPFFKELEDELLQNTVNPENVERAFRSYLNKVNEVAHLDIMGMYQEQDAGRNVMHVIARTKNVPHSYYYRSYDMYYKCWNAWEKMEVDIEGDHAIPMMYNRKLHVFWLSFQQTPEKVKKNQGAGKVTGSGDTTDNPEAAKVLEIQLAWSVKNPEGWSPKQLSPEKLIHPWERPTFAYHLKPRYKPADNSLWLDIYVSTSREFNNNYFYHQYKADKFRRARTHFNQVTRPWHSSSFVFNGHAVTEMKLRGIWAQYFNPASGAEQFMSSQQFVSHNFDAAGRAMTLLTDTQISTRLLPPIGMHFKFNRVHNNDSNTSTLSAQNNGFGSSKLLEKVRGQFNTVVPMQSLSMRPIAFQDSERAFFVKPQWLQVMQDYHTKVLLLQYVFHPLYHPYTNLLLQELNRSGVDGVLNRKVQTKPQEYSPYNLFDFSNTYGPVFPHTASAEGETDRMDFSFGGAYAIYNWELFFHAPMLIAGVLHQNQKFEDAMRWYHYIFNPTSTDNLPVPQRYWITKPFYEHSSDDYRSQRIENILAQINEFEDQITAWKNDPFKPHLIARYRPVAYQRNVVMKYITNLIAWGDNLFRQDTMESVNEAALLYLLAYEILGERPQKVPAIPREDKSYAELQNIDIFGNAQIEVQAENSVGLPIEVKPASIGEPLPRLEIAYFCIPANEQLAGFWDTVEDRLFKIRNCMNLDGVVRQLPLFAPPIDPALLVKAASSGMDISSILSDLSAPTPIYRFRTLAQVATRFAGEVKRLGDGLLSVLEKKDSEALALLRATHEIALQQSIKEMRKTQVEEAEASKLALELSKNETQERITHYSAQPFMNAMEEFANELHMGTLGLNSVQAGIDAFAATINLLPTFNFGGSGIGGSPHVTASWGGGNMAGAANSASSVVQRFMVIKQVIAAELEKQSGYLRQFESNQHQMRLAQQNLVTINQQVVAAELRKAVAEKDLATQELRIEQADVEKTYLETKYTNIALYNWMLTQCATIYFQAYQLAYDMAKSAERSYRHELGVTNTSFIQFGYWDSLKKGLLSGDKLLNDIMRMEKSFYEKHKRQLELTKHISLRQFFPMQLLQLKANGTCQLSLPEWLFNMDYPGHYMRRIKSVSITIPCIVGPYTGVHCTLSLTGSEIRISNLAGSGYAFEDDDPRRQQLFGAIKSIATSHAQNDSGMFTLNFEDDRFLPFEGMGAVSNWIINMPKANNRFDFNTISDVILHVQYTAEDGGATLASAANAHLASVLPEYGMATLSLRQQLPGAFYRFLNPDNAGDDQVLSFELVRAHYPFYAPDNVQISRLHVLVFSKHGGSFEAEITLPEQPVAEKEIHTDPSLDNTHHLDWNLPALPSGLGAVSMKLKKDDAANFQSLTEADIEDIVLVITFQ